VGFLARHKSRAFLFSFLTAPSNWQRPTQKKTYLLLKLFFKGVFDITSPLIKQLHSTSDWACSPMVGRSSGTLPTRIQILVLAPFTGFSRIYRRYASSGKRRSRRRAPLVPLRIYRFAGAQSFRGAHRGRVCVCVFIWVGVRACCERLRCTVQF
jgi:hypothetical protein